MLNPRDDAPADPNTPVSFIPMPAVSEVTGSIVAHAAKSFSEVSKGYTRFRTGDVIFAKITPCMENGKIAIATDLINDRACGSTEFHVFRPGDVISADYLWRYLRQSAFRRQAEMHMTGAVGQRRVPAQFLRDVEIPTPPVAEQRRIVSKLDSLFARSKSAREELDHVPKLVERHKQAVLAAAFRGELTAEWRSDQKNIVSAHKFFQQRRQALDAIRNDKNRGRDERSALIVRDADLSAALTRSEIDMPLPNSWIWSGLGELFGVFVGATPDRKNTSYWNGGVPWVSSGEVAFCHIEKTVETITESGLKNTSTRLHPPGTVLLGMIGEGKTRGQAAILEIQACNNQNSAAIRVSGAGYPPEYVYWYLYAVYQQTRTASAGNNQPALNKERVQCLPIPIAPPEEASHVVSAIKSRLAPMTALESEASAARNLINRLDQATLEVAFRGELCPALEESLTS